VVQAQYGWTDEQVLDIPICRLRQIAATVEARLKSERLYHQTITEWQTRTLAQFIAATVQMEKKGQKNPLMAEASKIRLRLEGDDDESLSGDDVPPEVYIEQGSQVAQNDNGSYERLRSAFAG
jgi:hypothetical protein